MTLRAVPALIAAALFGAVAMLWASGQHDAYFALARWWQFLPYRFPFLDGEFVVDASRCLHQGIDVYTANPCDTHEHTPFDYPPVWTLLGFLPAGEGAVLGWCLFTVAAFIASLLLLPAARDRRGCALIVLAVISSDVAYGVERANNELLVFAALAAGAALLGREGRARVWGYGLLYLAALMKYFPLIAMGAALRERPRLFGAIALGAMALTAALLGIWHGEVVKSLHAVPTGNIIGKTFGARVAPAMLALMLDLAPGTLAIVQASLVAAVMALGIAAGLRAPARAAVSALTAPEQAFLLVCALVFAGIFATGQHALYRAVHLLLVYPALIVLSRARLGWLGAGVWLVPVLLWWSALASLLEAAGDMAGLSWEQTLFPLQWLAREACWWWLMAILVAMATALLADAPLVGEAMARFRTRRLRAAGSSG